MTSTEFAAKYRLLKNVATRGARSFLAQQVALGRMVMVHYLESETPQQRAATLARLDALRPPAREKLLEVAEVDGAPVAVTLFISSFVDFTTWLESVSPASPVPQTSAPAATGAGEFTRAFNKAALPQSAVISSPPSERPASEREAPRKQAGEFTRIFGKVDEPIPAPSSRPDTPPPVTPADNDETPTVIMEAVKTPRAAKAPSAAPATPAPDAGASFTAIFGQRSDARRGVQDLPPSGPSAAAPMPAPNSIMPPVPPAMDLRPTAPTPVAPPAAAQQPGEFTQLFQRMSPGGGGTTAPGAMPIPPMPASEIARPFTPTPRADATPPVLSPPPLAVPSPPPPPSSSLGVPSLGAPSLGGASLGTPSLGAPSLGSAPPAPPAAAPLAATLGAILPAPSLANAAGSLSVGAPRLLDLPPMHNAAPPQSSSQATGATTPPAWGGPAVPPPIGGSMFGGGVQSEFTRILGRVAVPPPPPVSIQPPAAAAQAGGPKTGKSMMPLIIALNVLVLLTIGIVAYFVLRK